ncbi:hypothetical protein [Methylobacterium sp. 17Sr1-1]|uniref:gp53-like domain-containing protein n=1 Tax=Methylobacterium sp. 17Sr1-1 TaxID=2202826 RepID=UPI000D6F4B5E|nr:hypothetical protein [Methylobacterium sp. 17Sr1-1]AWN51589.1 hypothetical protein DK412_07700 [Methylobacterium sp. 17Sr1-1]
MALPRVSRSQSPAQNDNAINLGIASLDQLLATVSGLATTAYADAVGATERQARQAFDASLQQQITDGNTARQGLAARVQTVEAVVAKTRTAVLYAADRPGDGVSYFTGAPDNLGPLDAVDMDPARVVVTSEGQAIRLNGQQWVVSKSRFQAEPGRIGQARFALFRSQNAADPSNDTIRIGLLCYDAAGGSLADYPLADLADVTTVSGRVERSFRFTRDAALRDGVVNINPATRSVRLYVYTFGGAQQTNIEVMEWQDATDLITSGNEQHIGGAPGFGPELVAVANVRRAFANGVQPAFADRGLLIPAGQSGADSYLIPGLPAQGLSVGTKVRLRFDFQASADLTSGSVFNGVGGTVLKADGSEVGGNGSVLTALAPGAYRAEYTYTLTGGEARFDFTTRISGSARATPAFVALRSASIEVLATPDTSTVNAETTRHMEQVRARLALVPGYRRMIRVEADGSSLDGLVKVIDGVALLSAAGPAGADERSVVAVGPGSYLGECAPGATPETAPAISPADYVDVVGQGRPEDVQIVSRFPDNQSGQDTIQPFRIQRTGRIANLTVIGCNLRYPIHMEVGNAPNRAVQVVEDVIAIHEGATGWASPTAIGVGQHEANDQTFRRVRARSPQGAIGIHDNINWSRPSRTLIEDSVLHGTGIDGRSLVLTSTGSGLVSPVVVRGSTLAGHVRLDCSYLPGALLTNHKANRFGYSLTVYASSPIDVVGVCDVSALTLTSVAGASSAVAVSGPGAAVLFGATPDVRDGAADYAARVYSYHAVDVPTGEVDPGVTLAARLGNRSGSPLSLGVAWDGQQPVTVTLSADYRGMSNAAIVSALNNALASAMGNNAGGRAFSLSQPYNNRPPVHQPDREGRGLNVGSTTILHGMALAWSGHDVRAMTSTDATSLFAGFAIGDAVPGRPARFLRTGWIGQAQLRFDGTPDIQPGDRFQVSASVPGALVEGTDLPLLVVRSVEPHGACLEIIESVLFTGDTQQAVRDAFASITYRDVPGLSDAVDAKALRGANLSDLGDPAAARTNLGLGSVANLSPAQLASLGNAVGDAIAGRVADNQALGGASTVPRPYLARAQDAPWSLLEFGKYGGVNTGHTDLVTAALQSSEKNITVPHRDFNLEDAVALTVSQQKVLGSGLGSAFINRRASGSAAVPLLIIPPGVTDSVVGGIVFRHNGADKVNPVIGDGGLYSVPYGSAILVCGDRSHLRDLYVYDAWDNGIAVLSKPYGTGGAAGSPADVDIAGCRTYNCGVGNHRADAGGPGQIGSGVNNVSGANLLVRGHIDRGSRGAVTADDGGGASGQAIGCLAFENPRGGTGLGAAFYTGTNEFNFYGCDAYYQDGYGFWIAGGAVVSGGLVKGSSDAAMYITRNHVIVNGLQFKDIGYTSSSSLADVIRVDPLFETIDDLSIENVRSYSSQSNLPRYGYYEVPGRPYTVDADVSGRLRGRVAHYLTLGTSRASDPRRVVRQQLGQTGYRVWSDGEIEQWGYVGSSDADPAVTFPIPFRVKVWDLQATMQSVSTSSGVLETIGTSTPSLTGFTGYPRYNNGSTTSHAGEPWTWRARGQ